MVLDRQTAIEEIIKGVFDLSELQAVRLAGTIDGMVTSNRLSKARYEPVNKLGSNTNKKEEKKNA